MTRTHLIGIAVFTGFQVVMVIAGHYLAPVKSFFGVLGMALSLAAGLAIGQIDRRGVGRAIYLGGFAGGISGLVGIAIALALSDVQWALLLFGTAGSSVAGAIGGVLSCLIIGQFKKRADGIHTRGDQI